MSRLKPFDRYDHYLRAVQSPAVDCQFIASTYKKLRGKPARDLREDFCGTFALCCEWARRGKDNRAYGIDLDVEPLDYGRTHNLSKLREEQRRRVHVTQGSVLTSSVPRADVIVAMNFSYYLFKSRMVLRRYFKQALKGLRRDGLLYLDCFGGTDTQEANVEMTRLRGFQYFWDQVSFDPVTSDALFHIHFKRNGERKRERVFTYDWRLWTISEIRETLAESGFRRSQVYWEGTLRGGYGDGKFKRVERGEECNGWVAYIVAER